MPRALVTGLREQLGSAGAALGRAGFDVVSWEMTTPPPPSAPSFDCYVQLPCARAGTGSGDRGAAIGDRAVEDLVVRIDALAAVAARLGPAASVLLGIDEPGPPDDPEPGTLGPDLLAAVALALLADLGRPTARVAVISVAVLCAPPADGPVDLRQWEIPTPPLVSAP